MIGEILSLLGALLPAALVSFIVTLASFLSYLEIFSISVKSISMPVVFDESKPDGML